VRSIINTEPPMSVILRCAPQRPQEAIPLKPQGTTTITYVPCMACVSDVSTLLVFGVGVGSEAGRVHSPAYAGPPE